MVRCLWRASGVDSVSGSSTILCVGSDANSGMSSGAASVNDLAPIFCGFYRRLQHGFGAGIVAGSSAGSDAGFGTGFDLGSMEAWC